MYPTSAALPIIAHYEPQVSSSELAAAASVVNSISTDEPELRIREAFREFIPTKIEQAPAFHIDDLTSIQHFDAGADVSFYQERARLRAVDGDIVATANPVSKGYEKYCLSQLGLGSVRWVHPHSTGNPLRLAEACWEDEVVRTELVCRARAGDLLYIHPHMGSLPVWELAALLQAETETSIKVIAPPPRLTSWANDKVKFAGLVRKLFGELYVPRTMSAGNFAMLASHVKELSAYSSVIGIKLADSAGGGGTVVLESSDFASRDLGSIYENLIKAMKTLKWDGRKELLIDSWETQILSSPSIQLWIPPPSEGEPIIEGIFTQSIEGDAGIFVGSVPAELPNGLAQDIANRSWLLAKVFQQLGYIGRCSFDTLLVGESLDGCRLEFIECNGRWGGTSAPMTLMNRVFGDWRCQPHVSRICAVPGLEKLSFPSIAKQLGMDLYDRRTGRGRVIISMPGRMFARSAIDMIAVGATQIEASCNMDKILERIRKIAMGSTSAPASANGQS